LIALRGEPSPAEPAAGDAATRPSAFIEVPVPGSDSASSTVPPQGSEETDSSSGGPSRGSLSALDGAILVVGVVLGVGIFRSPSVVAMNAGSGTLYLGLWLLGGVVMLLGALCYAELATAYPDAGGEYYILSRGWGAPAGFLVAWSRMTVIQTGSLAILAYVFGDYVSSMLALGPAGPPALAAGVVVALTAVNVSGLKQGRWTQYLLTGGAVAAMSAVIVAGLFLTSAAGGDAAPAAGGDPPAVQTRVGRAMIFVLLAYGGWSEGAYVSAEIEDRSRGIGRVLLWGTGAITLLYVLVNAAYLNGLGLQGVAASDAVAADLLAAAVGPWGARVVTVAILLAALSSANATVITGARSNYAMGRDWTLFRPFGQWSDDRDAPINALLLQGGIALLLVGFGALERSGFQAMVDYTAPIYWLVLLFTGLSVIVLRRREPDAERPYSVPLYPITPILFAAAAAYMLYSSIQYAGNGALLGVAVMLAGVPFVWLSDLDTPRDGPSAGDAAAPEGSDTTRPT